MFNNYTPQDFELKNKNTRNRPVDSAHSLGVMARVPGRVEDNDTIGTNKIHSKTASSGGHQEKFDFGVCIEVINKFFSFQRAGAAVQSVVVDPGHPGILDNRY